MKSLDERNVQTMAVNYTRIGWINGSGTPLNASNLNKMDEAISKLAELSVKLDSEDKDRLGVLQRVGNIETTLGNSSTSSQSSKGIINRIEQLEANTSGPIQTVQDKIAIIENTINSTDSNSPGILERITNLETNINNENEETPGIHQRVEQLEDDYKNNVVKIDELADSITTEVKESIVNSVNSTMSETLNGVNEKMDTIEEAVQANTTTLTEIKEDVADVSRNYLRTSDYTKQQGNIESKIRELNTDVDDNSTRLIQLETSVESHSDNIENILSNIRTVNNTVERLNDSVQSALVWKYFTREELIENN